MSGHLQVKSPSGQRRYYALWKDYLGAGLTGVGQRRAYREVARAGGEAPSTAIDWTSLSGKQRTWSRRNPACLNVRAGPTRPGASETTTGLPGGTRSFTYDQLNRLASATDSPTRTTAGNPTSLGATTALTYDPAGQLTSTGHAYDGVGNRTATAGPTLGYDQEGRTSSASGAATTSYSYDGNGLRVAKTAGGTATRYTWDRSTGLPLLLSDGSTVVRLRARRPRDRADRPARDGDVPPP